MILIFRKSAGLRQINATGNVRFVAQSRRCPRDKPEKHPSRGIRLRRTDLLAEGA
jgi:hypothetical protein